MELKADRVEISLISDVMQKHTDGVEPDAAEAGIFYSDPAREQRINLLLHLIHYADLLLLSSAEGSGKTTLLAHFVERMGDGWQIHLLQGAALAQETSLSNRLADIFGSAGDGHADRVQHLINHIPRLRRLSKPIILIIDDAEKLTLASMQLLDKMLAAGDNYGKPVHIVLAGRPQLDDTLALPELAGLHDRIAHRLNLPPLSETHCTEFIHSYLDRLGADNKEQFNASVIKRICRRAEGYPGQIIDEVGDVLNAVQLDKGAAKSALPSLDMFDGKKGGATLKKLSSRPLIFGAIALGVTLAVMGVLRLGGGGVVEEKAAEKPVALEPTPVPKPEPLAQADPEESIVESLLSPSTPVIAESLPESAEPTALDQPKSVAVVEATQMAAKPFVEEVVSKADEVVPIETITAEKDALPVANIPQPVSEIEPVKETVAPVAVPREEIVPAPQVIAKEVVETPATEVATEPAVVESAPASNSSGIKRDDWLLQQGPEHFTLQLMAANNEAGVIKFIEENGLVESAAYFFSERDGNPWYAVTYGSYATRAEANAATLPPSLRGIKPWVRTFGGIHNAIRAAR